MNTTRPERSDQSDHEFVSTFDPGDVASLSETVLVEIVEHSDRPPDRFDRLNDYIDPDALDNLFRVDETGRPRVDARLSFHFDDYRVDIDAGDRVEIYHVA